MAQINSQRYLESAGAQRRKRKRSSGDDGQRLGKLHENHVFLNGNELSKEDVVETEKKVTDTLMTTKGKRRSGTQQEEVETAKCQCIIL